MHHTAASLQLVQVPRTHCSPYAVLRLSELPSRGLFLMTMVWHINIYICMYMYVNIHTDVNNSTPLYPGPSLGRALHSPPLGTVHLLCRAFPYSQHH